ncbi:MAG: RHS repeat-associated core domain-containing protein [Ruminococcaceae bacterium]|nr:RHS repeat-associated core domain-containing protein [Oscillospiraceae bacterium]
MVEYTYDAWGKLLNTVDNSGINLGSINPLRYRGYYYDQETGLYYLQSRYYDPTVGRFINADDISFLGANGTVLSHNLFSFCVNNPINFTDDSGHFGSPLQWVCAVISGVAGWCFGDYIARSIGLYPGKWWKWKTYAYWTVRGLVAAGGAILGWVSGTLLISLSKSFLVSHPNMLLNVMRKLGVAGLSKKIIKEMIKGALYSAGSAVLQYKKCPISKAAYHHGLYGNGKKWSSSALNNKIKNSSYFKTKLEQALSKVKSNTVNNLIISLDDPSKMETDIALSIGRVDLFVTGKKINGKWNLKVTGENTYNFDKFRLASGINLSNMANDIGLIMQRVKMITPYDIYVSFSVTF